jgi:DNA-binding NtrC family response regulator
MAYVLVAHSDEGVRDVIAAALRDVGEHRVLATSDGVIAIAALWLSERPLVALLDERLLPFSAMDVLRVAANDASSGLLARHHYILLSTWPQGVAAVRQKLLARLDAPVLELPFDLTALLDIVDKVQCGRERGAPASRASHREAVEV